MTNPVHQPPLVVRPSLCHLAGREVQVSLAHTFRKHRRLPFLALHGHIVRRAPQWKVNGVAGRVNPLVAHRRSHRTVRHQ